MLSDSEIRRLHQYGAALCGNAEDAFDLVQSAFEKILRGRSTDFASLKLSYYYTTVRHCFIDSLRARRGSPEIDSGIQPDDVASVATRSLEDLTIDRREILTLLESLAPWERELLYLHLVEEQTAQEIASTMGKPRGTILSMMHRLRKKINASNLGSNREEKR